MSIERLGVLGLAAVTLCSPAGSGGQRPPAPQAPAARVAPRTAEAAAVSRPEIFGPDIFGKPEYSCPTFSPDGNSIVLVKRHIGLVETRRDGDTWTEPAVLPFSGEHRDGDPFFAPDGVRLFFWSSRPVDGDPRPVPDLWVVDRQPGGWGEPRHLDAPVNTEARELFPAVAADGTLYFALFRRGTEGPTSDLYRARPTGTGYVEPEALGAPIHTRYLERDGFVSADQRLLVFASDRPGGFGKLDLYASQRQGAGWSPPRNLGARVNSAEDEYCPQLTPDGRHFVFTRASGIVELDASLLALER